VTQRATGRWNWQGAAVGLAVLAGLLLTLGPAPRASAELVESGKTRLRLDRALFAELEREGIEVGKVKQAKVQGRLVTLPVGGGLIEPASASGWVDSEGGLRLRSGRRVARLTEISVNTAKKGVWARLDGKRAKIAVVEDFGVSRAGFGGTIRVASMRLNAKAADHLDRRLGLDGVFRSGRPFAAVASTYQPEWVQAPNGSLELSFDPGLLARLKSVEVEPAPFSMNATGPDPLVYSSPILRGDIYPRTSGRGSGGIEGGFRLARPGVPSPVITVSNIGVSFESNFLSTAIALHTEAGRLGELPPGPFATVDLSSAGVRLDPAARSLAVTGARAVLGTGGAALINREFAEPKGKAPIVAAGDLLGTISVTLQGR
jgi:hypothetical protein